jgi:hypothetical protein
LRIIEDALTTSLAELDDCAASLYNELAKAFGLIDFNSAIKDRSNSMRASLTQATSPLKRFRWIPKTRDGQAPFGIDAQYSCDGNCDSLHILNLVLCLNNREAIGTNFLKLEAAALAELRKTQLYDISDSNLLGILITFDRDVLTQGKWDNSYADAGEYSAGFKKYYKPFLRSNILSLRMHS